jgi:hypothetical protein
VLSPLFYIPLAFQVFCSLVAVFVVDRLYTLGAFSSVGGTAFPRCLPRVGHDGVGHDGVGTVLRH